MESSSSTSNSPTNESLGEKCWIKFKNHWLKTLYSPFLVSFSAGNLEIDTFRNYIAHNIYFLRASVQAYKRAEEYIDDDEAKVVLSKLRESVLREIEMQGSFAQELGIGLPEESTPSSATVKYTDFLMGTASGKVYGVPHCNFETSFEKTKLPAYIVGAIAPLMRLYAFLGKELQTLVGDMEGVHPFTKWINVYSGESFHAAILQTEKLLDQLSVSFTREELDIIENLYGQALKLETEFLFAHSTARRTVVPLSREHNPDEHCLLLFTGFDSTCTAMDSCSILSGLAIIAAPESDQSQAASQHVRMSAADQIRMWTEITEQFNEENLQCANKILKTDRRNFFDYEALCKALEQVSDILKKANTRMIDSGVLKGLKVDDIKLAGKCLTLQDGCIDFFQSIIKNETLNTRIHVLSDCWCDDLIRSSFASGGLNNVNIHANKFVYEDSVFTGEIVRKFESPIDKVQAFTSIIGNCSGDRKNLTVYIGDSELCDLLCLLEADIGIVIGSNSECQKRLGCHFGVSFVPLLEGVIKKQKLVDGEGSSDWKGLSGVVYTVSSWTEIHSFILGW